MGLVAFFFLSLVFLPLIQTTQAQNVTAFLPTDEFNIPQLNGSVSFALNGSYSSAVLVNNSWIFKNLRLNDSGNLGSLKVSAENSKITIRDYRSVNVFGRSQVIRYFAEGPGVQSVNFEQNFSKPTASSEWMIIIEPTVFLSEGAGWHLLGDDTVVLTGQTDNVTVIHYTLNAPDDSNLPFYQQHSVALITIGVVAATVAAAVLISVKMRR